VDLPREERKLRRSVDFPVPGAAKIAPIPCLSVREVAQPIQTLLEGLRLEGTVRFEVLGERDRLEAKKATEF